MKLMSVLAATSLLTVDGDAAFAKVDNRRPAHQLEPGTVAAAVNHRFEDGKPMPRFGVGNEAWGRIYQNQVSGTYGTDGALIPLWSYVAVVLTAGTDYVYIPGDETYLTHAAGSAASHGQNTVVPSSEVISAGVFTATSIATYYLWKPLANNGDTANATIFQKPGNACGYGRFNDPNEIGRAHV